MLSLPEQEDLAWEHEWAKVVRRIPSEAWTSDNRAALSARIGDGEELHHAFTVVVAETDHECREELRKRIREGNSDTLDALNAFGDVRDLDADTVEALCAYLEDRINRQIADMQGGRHAGYASDPADTLVLINVWHPDHARWEPVRTLLSFHSPVSVSHVRGTLKRLRRLGGHVPEDVASTLVTPLRTRDCLNNGGSGLA